MGEHTINVRWSRSAQTWVPVPTQPSEQAPPSCAPAPTTERRHVSDAAAKVYEQWACGGGMPLDDFEGLHAGMGTVLLTVAEHDRLEHKAEILRQTKIMYTELSEERDNLRAELAARTQAWEGEEFKLRGELSDAKCEIERLRKGREDEKGAHTTAEAARVEDARKLAPIHADLAKAKTLASNFTDLDPRLGTPQPEGEPVGPMSQRKPYRWGMV